MSICVHLHPLVSSCVKLCKFLLSVSEFVSLFVKFYFIELLTQLKSMEKHVFFILYVLESKMRILDFPILSWII